MPLWAGPAFVPICCPPKCLRACHDLFVHNLVQPLSNQTSTSPEYRAGWGKPQPTARKELQPQPGLQPQSGPLASEAFLDRQRTGGLWTQRAQQLRNPGIWAALRTGSAAPDASARPTSEHGRQRETPFVCTGLRIVLGTRLPLQQGVGASLAFSDAASCVPDTLGSRPSPPSTLIIVLSCTSTAGPLRLVIPASHLSAPRVWARPERAGLDWIGLDWPDLAWFSSLAASSLPVCTCRLLRHSHPRARSFASAPSETLLGASDPLIQWKHVQRVCVCLWLVLES
ncbi:hypothetical protein THAR02_04631 [Trichoderma harzianum]|uniref:Uncharacterized protein n=1 Tax=Trichoderma harzianum TaxID=5544 RepID=A0A0G0AE04_TRIHA|nr:hypothetical protein THAR02_04631 [Trichoderma harzianum]